MKYVFENTIIEGPVKENEDGTFSQNVSIVGSLQKDDGTEIMKLTDSFVVSLTADLSISQGKDKINQDSLTFITTKYSG